MNRLRIRFVLILLAFAAMPAFANDTVYYYHTDAQGTAVVVTDANHNVVERTYYGPYGEVLNRALRDGPGYTGHEEDAATGLDNMQQRYYDPVRGQFPSVDPVDVDTTTGANFNRYAYANDNPYRYTDPDGRCTGTHTHHCLSGVKIILVNPGRGKDAKLGAVPGYSESGKNSCVLPMIRRLRTPRLSMTTVEVLMLGTMGSWTPKPSRHGLWSSLGGANLNFDQIRFK